MRDFDLEFGFDDGLAPDGSFKMPLSFCHFCEVMDLKVKWVFPLEGGEEIRLHEECVGKLVKALIELVK